jgi:hypothetical protein
MISDELRRAAVQAKSIYEKKLRGELEGEHRGEYVCIEPESGDYFLGATFDEAVNKAIDVYPDRMTHTLRVGHEAALHLGVFRQ